MNKYNFTIGKAKQTKQRVGDELIISELQSLVKSKFNTCSQGYILNLDETQLSRTLSSSYKMITTSAILIIYITDVIILYTPKQPSLLIINKATYHRDCEIKQLCSNNNVELMYIPDRCTESCQPLDVDIFVQSRCIVMPKSKNILVVWWNHIVNDHQI